MKPFDASQPELSVLFQDVVRASVRDDLGQEPPPEVERYLASLLVRFLHTDQIFAVRNAEGQRLVSVAEMIPEADVRLNAESFERERQVHQHIGDFLLFWSGLFPEFLRQLKLRHGADLICDYTLQGKESYYVVSTFDLPPHDREAPTFRHLSEQFEAYAHALRGVRGRLGGLGHA